MLVTTKLVAQYERLMDAPVVDSSYLEGFTFSFNCYESTSCLKLLSTYRDFNSNGGNKEEERTNRVADLTPTRSYSFDAGSMLLFSKTLRKGREKGEAHYPFSFFADQTTATSRSETTKKRRRGNCHTVTGNRERKISSGERRRNVHQEPRGDNNRAETCSLSVTMRNLDRRRPDLSVLFSFSVRSS